jgi:DNA-binding XRE family transcriptional regulator
MDCAQRFWLKVDKSGGPAACWTWLAARNKGGYGKFWDGGKLVYARRHAYGLGHGPILGGLCACHKCDNPACCNPDHIFLGTNFDNASDMTKKGRDRKASGERNGRAKLAGAQVDEIRAAYAAGGVTQVELGRRFGVRQTAISSIVRGKNWKG